MKLKLLKCLLILSLLSVAMSSLLIVSALEGFPFHDLLESLSQSIEGKILMNWMTIGTVVILVVSETLILAFLLLRGNDHSPGRSAGTHYKAIRPAAFLLLFGIDLSMSFVPLHMGTLHAPALGLPRDMVMGLPVSAEFFLAGVGILTAGFWLDRRGWHEPFLIGVCLAGAGAYYSWLAPDAVHFFISRALVGLGYGFSLMASQGFVIELSDEKSKAQGLAHLFAGIYAGSLCGGAVGAMLAERIGYRPVFLLGALILFSVLAYALVLLRGSMKRPGHLGVRATAPGGKRCRITRFLCDRTILSLIFLSSLPSSIAVVGFLNYFCPIYLNRLGTSQSTIGQILMIYGICLIYIGPLISRFVDSSRRKNKFVFLGCVLGGCAFLSFQVLSGFWAAAVAVFLLGLSSCLVLASQSAYALELKITQEFGAGKAIAIFRSTSRVGQTIGPILFSWLSGAMNTNEGMTCWGLICILSAFLFLLLTQKSPEIRSVSDEKIVRQDA